MRERNLEGFWSTSGGWRADSWETLLTVRVAEGCVDVTGETLPPSGAAGVEVLHLVGVRIEGPVGRGLEQQDPVFLPLQRRLDV